MSTPDETEGGQQTKNAKPKELQRLESFNQPGTGEEMAATNGARQRHLSLTAAKANYDISRDTFLGEMEQLEDPDRGA